MLAGGCVARKSRTRVSTAAASRSATRTTGDVEDLARHEAGSLAHEERHRIGDVLGLAHTANGNLRRRALFERLEVDSHPGRRGRGHLGRDEARSDGVRGYPERTQLDREGLGQSLQ